MAEKSIQNMNFKCKLKVINFNFKGVKKLESYGKLNLLV